MSERRGAACYVLVHGGTELSQEALNSWSASLELRITGVKQLHHVRCTNPQNGRGRGSKLTFTCSAGTSTSDIATFELARLREQIRVSTCRPWRSYTARFTAPIQRIDLTLRHLER